MPGFPIKAKTAQTYDMPKYTRMIMKYREGQTLPITELQIVKGRISS